MSSATSATVVQKPKRLPIVFTGDEVKDRVTMLPAPIVKALKNILMFQFKMVGQDIKKWMQNFGNALLWIRYKYDAEHRKKIKTVELLVEEQE